MRPLRIAPSILSADFARLGAEVTAADKAGGDWIHIDVMDGHFVPNLTFGVPVMQAVRGCTRKPFDVHLMIAPPDPYLDAFVIAGADSITVHVEGNIHLDRTLQAIKGLGKRAGVALNPGTPPSAIASVLDRIDMVLVMTVNPGFGGQAFIHGMLDKVRRVHEMVQGRNIDIEVDGGITAETAPHAVKAGANVLVAGSAVFTGGETAYAGNIDAIRKAATSIAV